MSRISRMFASLLGAVLSSKTVEQAPHTVHMYRASGTPRPKYVRNQRQRRKRARQRRCK